MFDVETHRCMHTVVYVPLYVSARTAFTRSTMALCDTISNNVQGPGVIYMYLSFELSCRLEC